MALPRAVRDDLQSRIKREWKQDVRVVSIDGRAVVIAPHSMAQGVTGAMDQVAGCSEDGPLFIAYVKAIVEANKKLALFDGLTPAQDVSRVLRVAARGGAGHVH